MDYTAAAHIQGFTNFRPDLSFRGPFEAKSSVRGPQIDPPGAREGSSILNVDLVVVTAVVADLARFGPPDCRRRPALV